MSCPKCRNFGPFSIFAFQAGWTQVNDNGTDTIKGRVEWEDSSECKCLTCRHAATVGEFLGKAPETFDRYQQIVVGAYAQGECQSYTPAEVRGYADPLLNFMLSELSISAHCKSKKTAIGRLDTAIRGLLAVRAAFEAKRRR